MNNAKRTISVIVITVIIGSLIISKPIYGANGRMGDENFLSGLIRYISQKFNLDKTKVQTAVQDYQKQKNASIAPRPTMSPEQRQAAEKKRFDNLVSQGKITADQETAILAELAAVRAKYPQISNATPEQRKAQMKNIQEELKTWAQVNKIEPGILIGVGRGGGFGGERGLKKGL